MKKRAPHPIKQFLLFNGLTERDFAAAVSDGGRPIAASYLSQIVRGVRRPRLDLARALSAATGGKVTIAEILTWEAAEEEAA